MGYFEISSKRDADASPLASRVQIADADIDRITVAYAQLYFPNGITEGEGEDAVTRAPTGQEVFDAVANGLLQGILANTVSVEKQNAAQAAQNAITPIEITPGA